MKRDTLLFDLDGTLTDTDALHFEAFQQLLAPYGRTLSKQEFERRVIGATNVSVMAFLFPDQPTRRHEELDEEKEALFRALADAGDVDGKSALHPTPGLFALIDWAEARGVKMAVVTNAPRPNAVLMLRALGLADRLTEIVIGPELPRGKPDPLPYLTGLDRVGSTADRALAFEDSRSGIGAAVAAGIETIGMLSSLDEPTLRQAGAAHMLRDFTQPWFLEKLDREFA